MQAAAGSDGANQFNVIGHQRPCIPSCGMQTCVHDWGSQLAQTLIGSKGIAAKTLREAESWPEVVRSEVSYQRTRARPSRSLSRRSR